jgi:hypothetical protein
MRFMDAIASFVFGWPSAERLPGAAIEALEDGYDTPSLRQLAGAEGRDYESIRKLLLRAMSELGVAMPSLSEAGIWSARRIARDILDGHISPYDGAPTDLGWPLCVRARGARSIASLCVVRE